MALQKKADLSTDTVFALGQGEGKLKEIKGYYLGSRKIKEGTDQEGVIHVFNTPKGNVGIWGTAKLNSNLTANDLGVYQEIIYKGKKPLAGGKTQHTYDFANDLENTIEVPRLSSGASEAPVQIVDADGSDEEEDTSYVGELNAAASRNRAAEVSAMLKKNKQA